MNPHFSKAEIDLLLNIIYREYDLPLRDYCKFQEQALTIEQKKLLDLCLNWIYHKSDQTISSDNINNLSLIEKLIQQRWCIDIGKYELAHKIFQNLCLTLSKLPTLIQQWVLFLSGKTHQHAGRYQEAQYVYDQLAHDASDPILILNLTIERAYLYYHQGLYQRSYNEIQKIKLHLRQNENLGFQTKILCNFALFLYIFGFFSEAISYFKQILIQPQIPEIWRTKAQLYLFQIAIESQDAVEARQYFSELRNKCYENTSELTFSFITFWIQLSLLEEDKPQAQKLCIEIESKYLLNTHFSHIMSYYADCQDLTRGDFLHRVRQCRIQQDQYSRAYLWLRQIRRGNTLKLSKKRIEITLQYLKKYFEAQWLNTDLWQTEALLMKYGQANIKSAWLERIFTMGHPYILKFLPYNAGALVLIADSETNTLWTSDGHKIELGKDKNTIPLLIAIQNNPTDLDNLIKVVFGDSELTMHSYQKLYVAIPRLNTKLNLDLISVANKQLRVRQRFSIYLIKNVDETV